MSILTAFIELVVYALGNVLPNMALLTKGKLVTVLETLVLSDFRMVIGLASRLVDALDDVSGLKIATDLDNTLVLN